MSIKNSKKIKVVLGSIPIKGKPTIIFEKSVINFFNELSINIKKNKSSNEYSDLMTFGFWCRKANIIKLSENYLEKNFMLGRGNVLHIAPSNVPMNFAYSFAFGMLSGNCNIVRLPSKNFKQIEILCQIISKICKKSKFQKILNKFCFIRYDKSDEISSGLSRNVDARLIWGGDETIRQFKMYKTPPRCIDLSFSDRYSISVIKTSKLAGLNNDERKNFVRNFYNDSYLMDQQGCSSPQAIVWICDHKKEIINKFWNILHDFVKLNYEKDLSITNKKISSIARSAIKTSTNFKTEFKDIRIVRLKTNNITPEIEKMQCHFGTFAEINIKKINDIKKIVSRKFQTVTYFGFKNTELEKIIFKNGITGIDRIVPVGRAHDIGPIWDGYDIIYTLARIVSN